MNLKELAVNPWIRSLWKASNILGCSIFDDRLAEYTRYDLELMGWLKYFDNPENIEKYRRSFSDPEFEDWWNEEAPAVEKKKVDVSNEDEWEEVDLDE